MPSIAPGVDVSYAMADVLSAAFTGAGLNLTPFPAYVVKNDSRIKTPGFCCYRRRSRMVLGNGFRRQNSPGSPNIYRAAILLALYEPDVDTDAAEALYTQVEFLAITAFNHPDTRTLNHTVSGVFTVGWDIADEGPLISFREQNYYGGYLTIEVDEMIQHTQA